MFIRRPQLDGRRRDLAFVKVDVASTVLTALARAGRIYRRGGRGTVMDIPRINKAADNPPREDPAIRAGKVVHRTHVGTCAAAGRATAGV